MQQKNSLAIILRTLLLLSMLIVVGCVRPEPTLTPSPSSVTPKPERTTAATATATWPSQTPIPTATGTPEAPVPDNSDVGHQRFLFVLDNSISLLNECYSFDQAPAHSDARAAMGDMTGFLVDVLGELSRAAAARGGMADSSIQAGVYTLYPYRDEWDAAPVRELVPMQDVAALEPGWDRPMIALLDAPGVNQAGWNLDWLLPDESDKPILDEEASNTIILLTDGYTGVAPTATVPPDPTKSPGEMRDGLVEQLHDLRQNYSKGLRFEVVQFDCPALKELIGTPTNPQPAEDPEWKSDADLWEVIRKDTNNLWVSMSLPRSTEEMSYSPTATWNSLAAVARELLQPFAATSLWPPGRAEGVFGYDGHGWLPLDDVAATDQSCAPAAESATPAAARLPTKDAPACLPGTTASFALRLVTAFDQPAGYGVVFQRNGRTFRRPLNFANSGHVYTLEPHDHALREVLSAGSEFCGPIAWWIEGPAAPAFYWWETKPAVYTIDADLVNKQPVHNNGTVEVDFRVSEVMGEPGHADCYTVLVGLGPEGENGGQIVQAFPMGALYPTLRAGYEFKDYPFSPGQHGRLQVSVALVEGRHRTPNGRNGAPGVPEQPVVVATVSPMPLEHVYEPVLDNYSVTFDDCPTIEQAVAAAASPTAAPDGRQLLADISGANEEDAPSGSSKPVRCLEVAFAFADENYWLEGTLPLPQFHALSRKRRDDLNTVVADGDVCRSLSPDENWRPNPAGGSSYRSGLNIGELGDSEAVSLDSLTYYTIRPGRPLQTFAIRLIPKDKLEACSYEAFLINWDNEEWDNILCTQTADYQVHCDVTDIRWVHR